MAADNTFVHLLAGGVAGTTGAVITCPLEVVKTRLQSSVQFHNPVHNNNKLGPAQQARYTTCASSNQLYSPSNTSVASSSTKATTKQGLSQRPTTSIGLYKAIRHIQQNEGWRGLFKGLGPNLVGVAPSRAVYFYSYAAAKSHLNTFTLTHGTVIRPDTPGVHLVSAACAGFTASTLTNPIWFIKTRLQLDQRKNNSITVWTCAKRTMQESGIRGFYRGITASYYGISETMMHFMIYEALKSYLIGDNGCMCEEDIDEGEEGMEAMNSFVDQEREATDFLKIMAAGATSKTIATCVAYPHEVARTRLREEGNKYRLFWQTLELVFREEGVRGLYRGLPTQLVRQIPNTAIMMSTYEAVVYLCSRHFSQARDQEEIYDH